MTAQAVSRLRHGDIETFSWKVLLSRRRRADRQRRHRAMMYASRIGVDSHGVLLLPHYALVLSSGRVNRAPHLRFSSGRAVIATLHADHAHCALATFAAMERAIDLS